MIIYDVKCENGHTFEGWFKDRQAWIEQNARRLICCPVCNSSQVEIAPSSLTIMGRDSKMSGKKDAQDMAPGQVGFKNVGEKRCSGHGSGAGSPDLA